MGPEALMALQVVSAGMTILGGINQADAMRETAEANARNAAAVSAANKANADFEAGQEQAAGQHAAEQARRKAMLMLSRAQAIAAASGGGALDENIAAGLIEQGEKEAGYNRYTADTRAANLRYKGDMGVYEANARSINEINQANARADATIMGSFASATGSMASLFAPKMVGTGSTGGGVFRSSGTPYDWD